MRKYIFSLLFALIAFHAVSVSAAPTSTIVQNLIISAVKNAPCLSTTGTGLVATTSCGTGSGATTTINGVSGPTFTLASSTYLNIVASGTVFTFTNLGVTSTLGNWLGTWQGVNSSTFYLASNPSLYISTSTFNATGTAFYVPYWNSAGTSLSATSTIYVSSTGNVGIGTTSPSALLTVGNNNQFTVEGSGNNVGVGIAAPGNLFQVAGGSGALGNFRSSDSGVTYWDLSTDRDWETLNRS